MFAVFTSSNTGKFESEILGVLKVVFDFTNKYAGAAAEQCVCVYVCM